MKDINIDPFCQTSGKQTLASPGAPDLPHCTHYAGSVSLLCSRVTALIFCSLCCITNNRQTRQLSVEQQDYLLCCPLTHPGTQINCFWLLFKTHKHPQTVETEHRYVIISYHGALTDHGLLIRASTAVISARLISALIKLLHSSLT